MRVMAGRSRSKNGVASLAYVPAIHVFGRVEKSWMPGTSPGMTAKIFVTIILTIVTDIVTCHPVILAQ
jgi:hypothetical protein